jgi:ubiquitin carboxyl-terminal hydrolase 22/27/51
MQSTSQSEGCEHMRSRKRDLLESYRMIVRYSLYYRYRFELGLEIGLAVAQESGKRKRGKKLARPFCFCCFNPLGRLYACIHCIYIGCWRSGHIQNHLEQNHHIFAVDFERCLVYCSLCNDFIYSHELDKGYNIESRRIHDMLIQIHGK